MTRSLALVVVIVVAACRSPAPAAAHPVTRSPATAVARPVSTTWPTDQTGQLDPATASVPGCRGRLTISQDSLGPIAPGWTLKQVIRRCSVVYRYWERDDEGVPEPAVALLVDGGLIRVTFEDTLSDSRVQRVFTTAARARTVAAVGPGSTVADLEKAYGSLRFGTAECTIYAWSPKMPGISWVLHLPVGWDCNRIARVDSGDEKPPATTRVSQAIVFVPDS